MKKNKADKSLWQGHFIGEESPMGSILSINDPIKDQKNIDLKQLRRKFATRGKIIKSEVDKKSVAGQTHKLLQSPGKKMNSGFAFDS